MHRVQRLYIDIPAVRPGTPGAFALAIGLASAATVARLAIDPYVEGVQFITFFPAVIVTSLVSGFWAGMACVVASTLAAIYFVLPPQFTFALRDSEQVLGVALFVVVAFSDVVFIAGMRLAISRYRELSRTLETRVEERTRELARSQERLAQAQKMEALGQLTGGLAHDFNNMLAVIVGNLDIMRRRMASGRADIARFRDHAAEAAQRASVLTQRLLSFARRQPLAPAVVDLNRLVGGLAELLRGTIGEAVTIDCIRAGGLWAAHVDPGQLESALVNLAVNARDAMPAGGTITIETANAYLDDTYARGHSEVTAGQYVAVAVSDTGVGMSPEVVARAFEPFFTTQASGKGTGLGLSQVHGFAKQSGGHVAIYSEPGRGTTVRIYLPRARDGQPAVEAAAGARADERAERSKPPILVVEDEDRVRLTTVAALQELGYPVHACASGAEALDRLDGHPDIAVLFTDVVMAGMNGRELAEAALRRRPDLRVLYTTGFTRNAIVHDGTLAPDVFLIAKPFTVDELERKLGALLAAGPR